MNVKPDIIASPTPDLTKVCNHSNTSVFLNTHGKTHFHKNPHTHVGAHGYTGLCIIAGLGACGCRRAKRSPLT